MLPGGQHHGLDGPTPIGDRKRALLHSNNNREWSLRDIRPCWCECAELAEHLLVLYHDEMPGLAVATARSQMPRFDDLPNNRFGDWLILKLAYGQNSTHCIKYLHDDPFCLKKLTELRKL